MTLAADTLIQVRKVIRDEEDNIVTTSTASEITLAELHAALAELDEDEGEGGGGGGGG